ncbi:hypothetical protein [Lacticaseibacillus yichunensis]|uniref:Uncharacterized protein n=1 Tax=Lacticaseibacillus yichunensis TaxID=2486015 RepID=A0ABW4CM65_9LACO|nr:hypothetical protein [Lacticaseibacillus yichunensis]
MALTISKYINITGTSRINEQAVMSLSANIAHGSGPSSVTASVINQATYEANKKETRADVAAFQQLVYDTEDQLDNDLIADDTANSTADD